MAKQTSEKAFQAWWNKNGCRWDAPCLRTDPHGAVQDWARAAFAAGERRGKRMKKGGKDG